MSLIAIRCFAVTFDAVEMTIEALSCTFPVLECLAYEHYMLTWIAYKKEAVDVVCSILTPGVSKS